MVKSGVPNAYSVCNLQFFGNLPEENLVFLTDGYILWMRMEEDKKKKKNWLLPA